MPPSGIRKEARESLAGRWRKGVHIVLAYLLFSFAIGFITGFISEESILYLLINLAYSILSVSFSFGLVISFMKLKRGEDVKAFGFITDGISRFGKSWGIAWHMFIRMLLPIVCVIVIAILLVGLYIFNFNASSSSVLGTLLSIFGILLYIATLIYVVSRALLYSLSYCIGYDHPELKSKDCVLKSAELMKGNRGNYFMLQLSFIGWGLLACFTLGIGFLWLMPYMSVAEVCFYERLVEPEVKKIDEDVKIEE